MTAIRRHAPLILLAAALTLTATAGCSSPPPDMTVHGTVTVVAPDAPVSDGSQVTVTDPSGKVIAVTVLDPDAPQGALGTLAFGFTVKVPEGEKFYGIHVDGLPGTVQFTQAQMKAGPALCSGDAC